MRRRSPLPRPLAATPFTTRDGAEAGLTRSRQREVDLTAPHRGVRLPTCVADELVPRVRAAPLALPDDAVVCGATAALLLGIPLPLQFQRSSAPITVRVPAERRAPRIRGVDASVSALADRVTRRHGMPLASAASVWCDLAATLTLPQLVAAGDRIIHHRAPLASLEALRAAVAACAGHRGIRNARRALELLDPRAESAPESELRVLLVLAGITPIAVNHEVVVGGFRYRIDLALLAARIAIEYQGDHHRDQAQLRRDRTRRSRLEAAGWFVIEVTADDLRNPADLLHRIAAVLAARTSSRQSW